MIRILGLPGLALVALAGAASPARATDDPFDFAKEVRPFFDSYCLRCHTADKAKGGVNLDLLTDEISLYRHRVRVEEVIAQLTQRSMPPGGARQPDDAAREKLAARLRQKLDHFDPEKFRHPGYLPSHRLTRVQYRNTIRDLIGVGMEVADDLPTDEPAFGFDHIGDVQDVSAIHLEKYLGAADYVLARVFVPPARSWSFDARKLDYVPQFGFTDGDTKVEFPPDAAKHEVTDAGHVVYHTGGVAWTHTFPQTGVYRFRFRVWGDLAEGRRYGPALVFKIDAHAAAELGVPTEGPGKARDLTVRVVVRAGRRDIKLDMEGMGVNLKAGDPARRFSRMGLDAIEITGPVVEDERKAREVVDRILVARPGLFTPPRVAARRVLEGFVPRAFRRPVDPAEVDKLLALFDKAAARGDSFDDAVKFALKAVLVSPHFLFHVERDRDPKVAYRVSDYELASRLSYFIWSSMPDQALFDLARADKLHDPATLEAQVRRLLKDPRSRALAENFAPQWLGLGSVFAVHREGKFHENNLTERRYILEEVVQFFHHLVREDRPVTDILDADYVFVNQFLATHYGIPGVTGREFRRVPLEGDLAARRGGVLGMAAVSFVTSHPTGTNPPARGRWVLDTLLGTPPPPPPPNVPALPVPKKGEAKAAVRERLAKHRADPNCAACHAKIDPIGFALENLDHLGAWRETAGGESIDAEGKFPDGTAVIGLAGLRSYLVREKLPQFRRHLAERVLTYGLRRGLDFYDEGPVRELVAGLARDGDRMTALVLGVVKSYPFQYRQNPPSGVPKK